MKKREAINESMIMEKIDVLNRRIEALTSGNVRIKFESIEPDLELIIDKIFEYIQLIRADKTLKGAEQ